MTTELTRNIQQNPNVVMLQNVLKIEILTLITCIIITMFDMCTCMHCISVFSVSFWHNYYSLHINSNSIHIVIQKNLYILFLQLLAIARWPARWLNAFLAALQSPYMHGVIIILNIQCKIVIRVYKQLIVFLHFKFVFCALFFLCLVEINISL